MKVDDIFTGLRVETTSLEQPCGLLAEWKYLAARMTGRTGIVIKAMRDHENAWWVEHDDGSCAPYWYSELQPGPPAPERPDPFKGRPIL